MQSQPFNRDYFHDNWCPICDFMGFWIFWKKGRGSSNFRKIWAIVLKLHTNIWHPSRNFGIEFGYNRLKRPNFFRFWIFWEFFQNCLTQANFDLSSWNFVGKCTNTEWCLIPNFIRPLNFRRIWFFCFFTVTSNYKNSMYLRSFLCEEAKIEQRTPWKKELCEIGEEEICGSRFTSFFKSLSDSGSSTSKHGMFSDLKMWFIACKTLFSTSSRKYLQKCSLNLNHISHE